jgi:hypothetical protein
VNLFCNGIGLVVANAFTDWLFAPAVCSCVFDFHNL